MQTLRGLYHSIPLGERTPMRPSPTLPDICPLRYQPFSSSRPLELLGHFETYTIRFPSTGRFQRTLSRCCPTAGCRVIQTFVHRIRYGADGAPKNAGPWPFPRPAPLNGLGRGVFFGSPCPCPRSGPRPTHTPDGSSLKIGGNKRGPVQGMSAGGPLTGAGR